MEAGYDYLLLRGRSRRQVAKYTGICLIVLGVLLLASGGAYYGYAEVARADLGDLNASAQEPATAGVHPVSEPGSASVKKPAVETVVETPATSVQASVAPITAPAAIDSGSEGQGSNDDLDSRYWNEPEPSETMSYFEEALLNGFTPVELGDLAYDSIFPSATRLIIPSIGVDSSVKELEILEFRGSRAYETPSNTVGHIPETANAGERGSSWFFGHTESPIGGEGSVFSNLGDIAEKLHNGDEVFIVAENGEQQFLYRVTSSEVVHQSDLSLYDTGEATIHLVSCVPRWVYDHRLVITGELVAQKINV